MPSKFELLPGEPILIQSLGENFDLKTDALLDLEQLLSILDQQTQPVFYIIDVRQIRLSLDDMLTGASTVTHQAEAFRHPHMREAIIITESRMMDLAARGLNSPVFGNIRLKVFGTLDEALNYARRNASMRNAI